MGYYLENKHTRKRVACGVVDISLRKVVKDFSLKQYEDSKEDVWIELEQYSSGGCRFVFMIDTNSGKVNCHYSTAMKIVEKNYRIKLTATVVGISCGVINLINPITGNIESYKQKGLSDPEYVKKCIQSGLVSEKVLGLKQIPTCYDLVWDRHSGIKRKPSNTFREMKGAV